MLCRHHWWAPQAIGIVKLIGESVDQLANRLCEPDHRVRKCQRQLQSLYQVIKEKKNSCHVDAPNALIGRKTSNPIWHALAMQTKSNRCSLICKIFIGCELLPAMVNGHRVPKAFAAHLSAMTELELSDAQIIALLMGDAPGELVAEGWTTRLSRNWIRVVSEYSNGTPPEPPLKQRIDGQLLASALNSSPVHTAGVTTDKDVTDEQLTAICQAYQSVPSMLSDLQRVLTIFVMRTSLTPDLAAKLPILDVTHDGTANGIDLVRGCLYIDFSVCVYKAGRAIKGCYPGGFVAQIMLPRAMATMLNEKWAACRMAMSLIELFPGESIPSSSDPIVFGHGELIVTWAKLRHGLGPILIRKGFNALHAAMLTLDFGLICRSKLHYACITPHEWLSVESRLYDALGINGISFEKSELRGMGCQIVPTQNSLVQHDKYLLQAVLNTAPGRNTKLQTMISFHNAYTNLTGWRLSLLLALRATQHVGICAATSEHADWIPLHDKITPDDRGWQPVPLCQFARETIRLYKTHCQSLAARISKLESEEHPIAKWASAVGSGRNMRMLGIITQQKLIAPLASHSFTTSPSDQYELPADVGRKVLENHLRWTGLSSSDIDAVLRHTMAGQVRTSSISGTEFGGWSRRITPAIQRFAEKLFSRPLAGLSRD